MPVQTWLWTAQVSVSQTPKGHYMKVSSTGQNPGPRRFCKTVSLEELKTTVPRKGTAVMVDEYYKQKMSINRVN